MKTNIFTSKSLISVTNRLISSIAERKTWNESPRSRPRSSILERKYASFQPGVLAWLWLVPPDCNGLYRVHRSSKSFPCTLGREGTCYYIYSPFLETWNVCRQDGRITKTWAASSVFKAISGPCLKMNLLLQVVNWCSRYFLFSPVNWCKNMSIIHFVIKAPKLVPYKWSFPWIE